MKGSVQGSFPPCALWQSGSHENIGVYMPFCRGSKVFRAAVIKLKRFLVWKTKV